MMRNRLTPYQYGSVCILFAAMLWGTTGTVASFAPDISPLAIGAFSMGVGGLIQACLACRYFKFDVSRLRQHKANLVLSTLALFVYPLAFYSSMALAGVAIGTVISIATAPFFSALLECLFGKKNVISRRWLMSFFIGVVGMALLVFSESSEQADSESNTKALGVVLGMVAGFTYAGYSWGAKTMINDGIRSQTVMGSIFGLGAILLLPTLVFTGDALFASAVNVAVISYMALVPMCLGYIGFGYGLRYVKASNANVLTLFEPVVAAVLAVFVVGESIPVLGWIGVVLILLCLLLQTKE
ncbi:DMT family transporter [Marinomonas algarum]|uniref:EamA family transporter n=1 Tax=Marinomonas algarum TaxID=2883105 RepID=A0A9X1LFG7_9GAMM|nr:EamA family transporter [Marinomonas algarum]MCB5162975.1 EamA family transporter [Marinomonas algarum]